MPQKVSIKKSLTKKQSLLLSVFKQKPATEKLPIVKTETEKINTGQDNTTTAVVSNIKPRESVDSDMIGELGHISLPNQKNEIYEPPIRMILVNHLNQPLVEINPPTLSADKKNLNFRYLKVDQYKRGKTPEKLHNAIVATHNRIQDCIEKDNKRRLYQPKKAIITGEKEIEHKFEKPGNVFGFEHKGKSSCISNRSADNTIISDQQKSRRGNSLVNAGISSLSIDRVDERVNKNEYNFNSLSDQEKLCYNELLGKINFMNDGNMKNRLDNEASEVDMNADLNNLKSFFTSNPAGCDNIISYSKMNEVVKKIKTKVNTKRPNELTNSYTLEKSTARATLFDISGINTERILSGEPVDHSITIESMHKKNNSSQSVLFNFSEPSMMENTNRNEIPNHLVRQMSTRNDKKDYYYSDFRQRNFARDRFGIIQNKTDALYDQNVPPLGKNAKEGYELEKLINDCKRQVGDNRYSRMKSIEKIVEDSEQKITYSEDIEDKVKSLRHLVGNRKKHKIY